MNKLQILWYFCTAIAFSFLFLAVWSHGWEVCFGLVSMAGFSSAAVIEFALDDFEEK